ncbi:MAG: hypothetical protein KGQ70_00020 [Alphaproteobacteria bacterium]|nr:hypothetical protein [Alphaproteobacteria bacterium]
MLKFFFTAFALLVMMPAAHATQTAYFSAMDDLPVMQGMVEQPADTVIFDKPAGRIVEFSARTAEQPRAVLAFYGSALPPLGWKPVKKGVFVRAHEKLKMDFAAAAGETLVRFTLTPDGKGE